MLDLRNCKHQKRPSRLTDPSWATENMNTQNRKNDPGHEVCGISLFVLVPALNTLASRSHGEASIRTCTHLMLSVGGQLYFCYGLPPSAAQIYLNPSRLHKREVVNIAVPMTRGSPPLPPPPPPSSFPTPRPYVWQGSTGHTQNVAGNSPYIQGTEANPSPGNNHFSPSQFSYIATFLFACDTFD